MTARKSIPKRCEPISFNGSFVAKKFSFNVKKKKTIKLMVEPFNLVFLAVLSTVIVTTSATLTFQYDITASSEGRITSPNFPNDYPLDSEFIYKIQTTGNVFRLYVWLNILSIGGTSSSAYIAVYGDEAMTNTLMSPYCCGPLEKVFMNTKIIMMKFKTDPTTSGQGFEVFYKEFANKDTSIKYAGGQYVSDTG